MRQCKAFTCAAGGTRGWKLLKCKTQQWVPCRGTSFWEKMGMQSSYELLSKIYECWVRQIKSQKMHTQQLHDDDELVAVKNVTNFRCENLWYFHCWLSVRSKALGEVKWWRWTTWRRARPTVNHFVRFQWDNFKAQRKSWDSGSMRVLESIIRNMKYWS